MVDTIAALIAEADRLTAHHRADAAATRLRRALAADGPGLEDRARLNVALARSLLAARDGEAALDAVCAAMVIDLPDVLPALAAVLDRMAPAQVQGAMRLVRHRAAAGLTGAARADVLVLSGRHSLRMAEGFAAFSSAADPEQERRFAALAVEDLTEALEVPQPVAVREMLARARGLAGDWQGAAELWARIAAEDKGPTARAQQAQALRQLGDLWGAAAAYEQYLGGGMVDDAGDAALALAEIWQDLGEPARALAPARLALAQARAAMDPAQAGLAGGLLGRLLVTTGTEAEARQVLREALPLLAAEWGDSDAATRAAAALLAGLSDPA